MLFSLEPLPNTCSARTCTYELEEFCTNFEQIRKEFEVLSFLMIDGINVVDFIISSVQMGRYEIAIGMLVEEVFSLPLARL